MSLPVPVNAPLPGRAVDQSLAPLPPVTSFLPCFFPLSLPPSEYKPDKKQNENPLLCTVVLLAATLPHSHLSYLLSLSRGHLYVNNVENIHKIFSTPFPLASNLHQSSNTALDKMMGTLPKAQREVSRRIEVGIDTDNSVDKKG